MREARDVHNVAASVNQRLLNRAPTEKVDFGLLV